MTTRPNDSRANPRATDDRQSSAASPGRANAEHRLRGTEQAADFSDAEGDSCVVARKRDEKESDS
jgi:hypothetical protein